MRLTELSAIIIIICLLLACALIVLDILSFVDMKRKRRGKWEWKEPHSEWDFFTCSVCGRESETKTDYCCHCGADMRRTERGGEE